MNEHNCNLYVKRVGVGIKTNTHQEHMVFQESEYFKGKSKERYKIEAKTVN